jgi:hypothetical protein
MLLCPDPNTYSGPLYLQRHGTDELLRVPLTHDYNYYDKGGYPEKDRAWPSPFWAESRRGLAVADMAWAITNNRPHRCNAELGLHAFEIIHAVDECARTGKIYTMTTSPAQPAPLPAGFIGGAAEKALDN